MKFLSHPTLDNFDIGSSGKVRSNKNSWVASAGLIAAAMAGAGVVSIFVLAPKKVAGHPNGSKREWLGWHFTLSILRCA